MNKSTREVLRYLAGNQNIETIPLDDLQKLADEHPYFPVAQFLLAKKLKAENDTGFLPQAQKTALYFSNPYWLDYQLTNHKEITNETDVLAELSEEKETHEITAAHAVSEVKSENNLTDENVETLKKPPEARENEAELVNIPNKTFITRDAELAAGIEKANQPEEEMAAIIPEPDKNTSLFLDQLDNVAPASVYNNNEEIFQEVHTPQEQETATEVLEEMAGVSRETDETTEVFLNEAETSAEENVELSAQKTETSGVQAESIPFVSDTEKENKNDKNGEPDEHERMFQNIKAMLEATSEEADANVENAVIPIDPYYTIDYFASQGIKLELEQNPKDQLGQHLKKFTQWLKHMKKLGPEDATEVIARTETEADIPKIAESSNTVREVVTEAMASVLEKQGKKDKAIELYKKLSFLNPDKALTLQLK